MPPKIPQQSQYPSQTGYSSIPQGSISRLDGWYASYYDQLSPSELQNLQSWFTAVDRDHSGTISAAELATMPLGYGQLGMECATKLIKAFDKDNSNDIDFYEYAALNQFISKMSNAFSSADRDRNGYLDYKEIHSALSGAGFSCSVNTVQSICKKYDFGYGISLVGFIGVCAQLAAIRSAFEINDTNRTGKITMTYDQLSNLLIQLTDK